MVLALSLVPWSFYTNAREFITIIGPDGRPLVVPRQNNEQKETTKNQAATTPKKLTTPVTSTAQDLKKSEPKIVEKSVATVQQKNNMVVQPVQPVQPTKHVESRLQQQLPPVTQPQTSEPVIQAVPDPVQKQGFSEIEGVEYVDSEYLENKEFNLEGKKRFYSMPEGIVDKNIGSTRVQTIEREKGVGQSIIKSLFQQPVVDSGPVVLAQTYYRISQPESVESLGKQCFKDKKVKNAKEISAGKSINLWPRAPLKSDEFDYEIVKLKSDIKNIQIQSYASRQNNPAYYWPFVVFLDERGCVLEGAGGFKNQEAQANIIQHEKIQGIIQIPAQSQYVLMTPLASAIDVEDKMLTNYGQLKLVAIR